MKQGKIIFKMLIASVVLATSLSAMASRTLPNQGVQNQVCDITEDTEVFVSATHMPYFPGGDAAMIRFLQENLKYPFGAAQDRIEGKVIVQFVVEKNGKVGEVKVARSVNEELDKEAVRVCKLLPDFTPGRNANNEPVRVWYTLPIIFKLPPQAPAETD